MKKSLFIFTLVLFLCLSNNATGAMQDNLSFGYEARWQVTEQTDMGLTLGGLVMWRAVEKPLGYYGRLHLLHRMKNLNPSITFRVDGEVSDVGIKAYGEYSYPAFQQAEMFVGVAWDNTGTKVQQNGTIDDKRIGILLGGRWNTGKGNLQLAFQGNTDFEEVSAQYRYEEELVQRLSFNAEAGVNLRKSQTKDGANTQFVVGVPLSAGLAYDFNERWRVKLLASDTYCQKGDQPLTIGLYVQTDFGLTGQTDDKVEVVSEAPTSIVAMAADSEILTDTLEVIVENDRGEAGEKEVGPVEKIEVVYVTPAQASSNQTSGKGKDGSGSTGVSASQGDTDVQTGEDGKSGQVGMSNGESQTSAESGALDAKQGDGEQDAKASEQSATEVWQPGRYDTGFGRLYVRGQEVSVGSLVHDGVVYLPLRKTVTELGGEIFWGSPERVICIVLDETKIFLDLQGETFMKNGRVLDLEGEFLLCGEHYFVQVNDLLQIIQ